MIEFPLFTTESKYNMTPLLLILGGIIIFLFFLFPALNPGIFIIIIIIVIVYQINKKDKPKAVGKVYFNTNQIKIITESHIFHIEANNLSQFELIYSGHTGKRMQGDFIGSFNSFSGIDNFIHISNSDKHDDLYKYRFLVENSTQENSFMELISVWKNLGYDINNIRIVR